MRRPGRATVSGARSPLAVQEGPGDGSSDPAERDTSGIVYRNSGDGKGPFPARGGEPVVRHDSLADTFISRATKPATSSGKTTRPRWEADVPGAGLQQQREIQMRPGPLPDLASAVVRLRARALVRPVRSGTL
ncbi:hypothetical protein GCM10010451_35880 [Streptomyces virens]|uniref:Uncharacterized protein n=1 Tax=Streptomyces virens TaxID=285572 RepID=A0ABP6PMN3_9ACTN